LENIKSREIVYPPKTYRIKHYFVEISILPFHSILFGKIIKKFFSENKISKNTFGKYEK
jgi:hypothetical protein